MTHDLLLETDELISQTKDDKNQDAPKLHTPETN